MIVVETIANKLINTASYPFKKRLEALMEIYDDRQVIAELSDEENEIFYDTIFELIQQQNDQLPTKQKKSISVNNLSQDKEETLEDDMLLEMDTIFDNLDSEMDTLFEDDDLFD